MNILFCGDKNISDGLLISVLSLLKNVREPLKIFILTLSFESESKVCEPLTTDFAEFLDRIVKEKNKENSVTLIDTGECFKKQMPLANLETRFTPCCMLRLYADLIEELPDRILYLDNDVICRKEFSDIYNTNMENTEIAGVLDYYGKWFFHSKFSIFDYLNSGVLLLNLKEIRKTGLFEKCRKRCAEKKMFMPDQSAINKLAKNKKILPRKFNEQRKLKSDTVLQHFTTSFRFFPLLHTVTVKPWQIEKLHSVLKIYEYDEILEEYKILKNYYKSGDYINEKQ